MTKQNIVEIEKEEVKESKIKKHFKKHKNVYITVAGAGLTIMGIKYRYDRKIEQVGQDAYLMGAKDVNNWTWDMLARHAVEGNIKIELIKDIEDEGLKGNLNIIKDLVEAE